MIIIHYSKAFKALDAFIDEHNARQKKSDKIKCGTILTAKEIIRIYGISLLKATGITAIDKNNLPSLKTNNCQLAKLVKCSTRTIQRHIQKLKAAGIITQKVYHGSNSGYELWINKDILLIKGEKGTNKHQNNEILLLQAYPQINENQPFLPGSTTKSRHTYTGNINNNLIIGVENANSVENKNISQIKQSNTGNVFLTGNTGEKVGVVLEKENKSVKDTGEKVSRAGQEKAGAVDPARGSFLNLYVNLFWMMARNVLYSDTMLTERQQEVAKNLIRKLYEPASTGSLSRTHQHYCERISLVAKYVRRDPQKRFVPLPYIFFNTNNPNGFVGTKKWHQQHRQRKIEIQKELVLDAAIKKYFSNYYKNSSGQKPPLKMFRECESRLGKLGDPLLLQRFHAAVLNPGTYTKIHNN